MTKQEQERVNALCIENVNAAIEEYKADVFADNCYSERLRKCNAEVYETGNFYLLKSYNTFVACIPKGSCECFDVLRVVYGYTNSSAKQISKFIEDYGYRHAEHYVAK